MSDHKSPQKNFLKQYDSVEISGKDFLDNTTGLVFVKLFEPTLCHDKLHFRPNCVIRDSTPFDPTIYCRGGIYFSEKNDIFVWVGWIRAGYIAKVTVLPTSRVFIEYEKKTIKADVIKIEQIIPIFKIHNYIHYYNDTELLDEFKDKDFVLALLSSLRFINSKDCDYNKTCDCEIKNDAGSYIHQKFLSAIQSLHELQTNFKKVSKEARKKCMELIEEDLPMLRFIQNPSRKLRMYMIKHDYRLLNYIEKQTEKLCLKAIEINPLALMYVKKQTFKMCLNAFKKDQSMYDFIDPEFRQQCLKVMEQRGQKIILEDRITSLDPDEIVFAHD